MAMTNTVIADGKTTPVNHTFVPQSAQAGTVAALYYNKVTGFSTQAWERLKVLVNLSPKPKGDHKVSLSIALPKVVIIDSEEVKQGELASYVTMIIPAHLATDDNLKDLKALTANAMDHALANQVFVTLVPAT